MRQFADGVADQPVVGCVVVRHERHADHHEDDVCHRQIQQQEIHGRPHLVSGKRHNEHQQVAQKADKYDDAKHCWNGDFVQNEVEHKFVFIHEDAVFVG